VDGNGKLSVDEFVPVAFDMLVSLMMQLHRAVGPVESVVDAVETAVEVAAEVMADITAEEVVVADTAREEAAEEAVLDAKINAICEATNMSEEELQAALENVFIAHDTSGNGVLEQTEFARCVADLGRSLNLDRRVAFELFKAVDVNGDGGVEWREFVGPAVHIIFSNLCEEMNAAEAAAVEDEDALRNQVIQELLNGMSNEDLEEALRSMFEAVDTDGSGKVDVKELRTGLQQMGLKLSDQDLNCMIYEMDIDGDGLLSLQEFLPMAFDMLVSVMMQVHKAHIVVAPETPLAQTQPRSISPPRSPSPSSASLAGRIVMLAEELGMELDMGMATKAKLEVLEMDVFGCRQQGTLKERVLILEKETGLDES